MRAVFILSKEGNTVLLASNVKVIYEALTYINNNAIELHDFKSYSWFTKKFKQIDQVAVPTKRQWHFVVSKRNAHHKFHPPIIELIL